MFYFLSKRVDVGSFHCSEVKECGRFTLYEHPEFHYITAHTQNRSIAVIVGELFKRKLSSNEIEIFDENLCAYFFLKHIPPDMFLVYLDDIETFNYNEGIVRGLNEKEE